MPDRPQTPPLWIDTSAALESAFQRIQPEPRIAVDTESNSLFAYQEEVCLIQISTPVQDFLFDPFVLKDLSLLGALFNNPAQEKIFHASEYDLICLKRDFKFEFTNIFDTMIAARILGETQVGLGSLLLNKFEIILDKKYQRANWGLRPLPPEMLDYARLDTHYLFQLRDELEKQLIDKQLLDLAREDFILACAAEAHNHDNHQAGFLKPGTSNHADPLKTAIIYELCFYRDEQAKKANLPHFKVLSNDILYELADQKPKTLEELSAIHGCTEKVVKRHGPSLLKAIVKAESTPPPVRHRMPKPDDAFLARLDKLKEWRKATAKELKVESDVVLPRELMESIASGNPSTRGELRKLMTRIPYRFTNYGQPILKAIRNKETK
jgi:ribonuclease D